MATPSRPGNKRQQPGQTLWGTGVPQLGAILSEGQECPSCYSPFCCISGEGLAGYLKSEPLKKGNVQPSNRDRERKGKVSGREGGERGGFREWSQRTQKHYSQKRMFKKPISMLPTLNKTKQGFPTSLSQFSTTLGERPPTRDPRN